MCAVVAPALYSSTQSPGAPPLDSISFSATSTATHVPASSHCIESPHVVPPGCAAVPHSPVSESHVPVCTLHASTGSPALQRGEPAWQTPPAQVPSVVHLSSSSHATPSIAPE